MAKLPLSQTVDASLSQRSWRSSILSLLTSMAVQFLTITVLVVTPLLVAQTLPEPMSQLALPRFVSVEIQPPVARGPEPPADPRPVNPPPRTPTIQLDSLVPHPLIPDRIPEADTYFAPGASVGVPGGLPHGLGGTAPTPLGSPQTVTEKDPEPIRISGELRPPKKLFHVNPDYPSIARASRIQGTVTLQAIIDIDGKVSNLSVIESVRHLDRAAIEAVRQWRYEPTRLDGRAVPVIMTVEVTFQLR